MNQQQLDRLLAGLDSLARAQVKTREILEEVTRQLEMTTATLARVERRLDQFERAP